MTGRRTHPSRPSLTVEKLPMTSYSAIPCYSSATLNSEGCNTSLAGWVGARSKPVLGANCCSAPFLRQRALFYRKISSRQKTRRWLACLHVHTGTQTAIWPPDHVMKDASATFCPQHTRQSAGLPAYALKKRCLAGGTASQFSHLFSTSFRASKGSLQDPEADRAQ